jgi:hypothetical protein
MLNYTVVIAAIVSDNAIVLVCRCNQRCVANGPLSIYCYTTVYVQALLELTSAPELIASTVRQHHKHI